MLDQGKRVIGVEPTTFSLGSCQPASQGTDLIRTYGVSGDGRSVSVIDLGGKAPVSNCGNEDAARDLRTLVDAWGALPVSLREGIMAIISEFL